MKDSKYHDIVSNLASFVPLDSTDARLLDAARCFVSLEDYDARELVADIRSAVRLYQQLGLRS